MNKYTGFTLIEILIVVAIMTALLTIGIPIYTIQRDASKQKTAAIWAGEMQRKILNYYTTYGYPNIKSPHEIKLDDLKLTTTLDNCNIENDIKIVSSGNNVLYSYEIGNKNCALKLKTCWDQTNLKVKIRLWVESSTASDICFNQLTSQSTRKSNIEEFIKISGLDSCTGECG